MKQAIWFFIGATVIIIIVVFRKEIGSFFGINSAKEGDACKDAAGNAGTIKNGECVKSIAEGSACMLNGKPGSIVNGACVPTESATRVIVVDNVPKTIKVAKFFGRKCRQTITTSKYPGYTWILTGSDKLFCYYKRA